MRSESSKLKESGQGLVEFALAFPIVFLIILVILELGFAFNAYQTVVYAARSGARSGAVYMYQSSCGPAQNESNRESGSGCTPAYTDNIRTAVAGAMPVAWGFDPTTNVTVSYDPATRDDALNPSRRGEIVNVTVSYEYGLLTQVLGSATITLTGTASQRIEP